MLVNKKTCKIVFEKSYICGVAGAVLHLASKVIKSVFTHDLPPEFLNWVYLQKLILSHIVTLNKKI